MNKRILSQWLKAGYIEKKTFHNTEMGTPQGGVISPVLANMVLDGLEPIIKTQFKNHKVNMIRFADDFIITGNSEALLNEKIKPMIEKFLLERGLELSKEKTRTVSIYEGFDFLGMNVRKYSNKKLFIKPSKKSIKKLLSHVKEIIMRSKQTKTGILIEELNPILRGWANYNRHVVSHQIFSHIDSTVWQMIWRWCKRRHPNTTNRQWIMDRYFKDHQGKRWMFAGKTENGKVIYLFKLTSIPIKRHVKIRNGTNPYDPQYEVYLEQRLSQKWQDGENGTGRLRYLWLRQNGSCPKCNVKITKETGWHTHHLIRRVDGGKDTLENLALLHPACHHQIHANEHKPYRRILQKNLKKA